MPKQVQHYWGVEKILNPFKEQSKNKYPTLSHSFNVYGASSTQNRCVENGTNIPNGLQRRWKNILYVANKLEVWGRRCTSHMLVGALSSKKIMLALRCFCKMIQTYPNCLIRCFTFGMVTTISKHASIHEHEPCHWGKLTHFGGLFIQDTTNGLVEFLTTMMDINKWKNYIFFLSTSSDLLTFN